MRAGRAEPEKAAGDGWRCFLKLLLKFWGRFAATREMHQGEKP